MSIVTRSTGSHLRPSISRVTTSGLPTVSSKPSRRIVSTSTASCSSPRAWTSHASGRSVGLTRMLTLPTSSASSRFFSRRAVIFVPSRPASGEVLMPIVIDSAGSSTVITGNGRGSSGSASVSPIVISAKPATATRSPGPASSTGTRVSCLVRYSSTTLARWIEPSMRHHATCWPLRIVPSTTRHSASRPRYGLASRLVTHAWSGAPSV